MNIANLPIVLESFELFSFKYAGVYVWLYKLNNMWCVNTYLKDLSKHDGDVELLLIELSPSLQKAFSRFQRQY